MTKNPLVISAYHFLAAEIIQEVKSDRCASLEYEKLSALLELVLDNQEVIDILRKTPVIQKEIEEECVSFEYVYQNHVIEGKHEFDLMPPMDSLALSWLFQLYH